jgi:hypothetical protein
VADILGLIGFGAFLSVSVVLGVRLLALARRTRKLPELAIGLNFLLAGAVGYALLLAAESLRLLPAPWDGWASFAGVTAISIGAASVGVFSRAVFRPASRAAGIALAVLVGWLLLGVFGSWMLHVLGVTTGLGGWLGRWGPNLGLLAAYGWSAVEPLRFHLLMRRRLRIGMGDPLVANRLLLWALGTGAIAAVAGIHLVGQLFGRYELPPSLVGVVSLLVLATAVSEWLAFFPPRAWRERFAARRASAS